MFRELVTTVTTGLGESREIGSGQVLLTVKDELARRQQEGVQKMAERQVALQVAMCRERLTWLIPMVGLSTAFLVAGYRVTRSCVVLYPLVPMCFAASYQYDLAYGNKTNRIKGIAERILAEETSMIHVPEWHYTRRGTPRADYTTTGLVL